MKMPGTSELGILCRSTISLPPGQPGDCFPYGFAIFKSKDLEFPGLFGRGAQSHIVVLPLECLGIRFDTPDTSMERGVMCGDQNQGFKKYYHYTMYTYVICTPRRQVLKTLGSRTYEHLSDSSSFRFGENHQTW